MANTIKIKRSTTNATPSSLAEGELAYSETSGNLFIGTSGGNIANIGGVVGSKIQAYDANTAKYNASTANFTGDLQVDGVSVVVSSAVGLTIQPYNANTVIDSTYSDNKSNWNAVYTWYTNMTTADQNSIIDTINEMLNAFSTSAESLNVYTQLTSPTSMTLDGGEF